MRRQAILLVMLGAVSAVLISAWPAIAWNGWPYGPGAWVGVPWGPVPSAPYPVALPYGSRFRYPPGFPLSYYEPTSGETYCLSRPTGFYYVCGYSGAAQPAGATTYPMPPAPPPPLGEMPIPPASGVLLFRLPQDAEVAVDGAPVGLSEGLGITSVTPGPHRVVVRASGGETVHTVAVNPHAIFTVTPTAVIPTLP